MQQALGPGRVHDPRCGDVNWSVRQYIDADCAGCMNVFFRAVQIGAAGAYDQAQRDAWCPEIPQASQENCDRLAGADSVVAELDGTVIGFMSLEKDGHLDMAFVAPEHMGQGVAGALYDQLFAKAQHRGLCRLNTEASHLARGFFARKGWQVVKPETVTRRGVSLERFRMQIEIGEKA